jgi:hypothetical protein
VRPHYLSRGDEKSSDTLARQKQKAAYRFWAHDRYLFNVRHVARGLRLRHARGVGRITRPTRPGTACQAAAFADTFSEICGAGRTPSSVLVAELHRSATRTGPDSLESAARSRWVAELAACGFTARRFVDRDGADSPTSRHGAGAWSGALTIQKTSEGVRRVRRRL